MNQVKDVLDSLARFLWPPLLACIAYLFLQCADLRAANYEFRLYVAENYTSKQDLKEMLQAMEERMDKRLGQLVATIIKE